ncbi:MAG TPA: FAD-binding oxidoreductase [Candidatus Limnocylindrales bacterium]|nr:FAD-binding oxidoreductase [Candidatus Limnocylindrales bacterium]
MNHYSYWLDTAPAGPDFTNVPLPERADVVVVGGGLTGLSAAVHLRKKGASVVVLEAEKLGWGASGRNGGMATTGLTIGFRSAIDRYGEEAASRMYLAYDAAIDTVERLVREESIDCDFARTGKLNLAAKPAHYERYARTHEALKRVLGHETTLVPKERMRTEVGTDYYHGGLVDPRGAGLHVGKFVRGMAGVADRLGAELREDARVTGIKKRDGRGHEVRTKRGTVAADKVVIATDGYTDGAVPDYRRRIVPVGSFIVATEPLERSLVDELMPTRRMASDSKNLLYYFRITPDDRLLFGGRARFTLSNPESDLKSALILRKGMKEVFPQLAEKRIDYAWGGQVGITLDRMPHAGERDGVFYSIGYNGHGVQMATHMGRQVAEMMDGHAEANPWRGLKFRPIPGHFGPPWFLPFADAYYRMKDAVS